MDETQIKYCFIGNLQKNISIYEFINTDSPQIIFEAKFIFNKFVEDKKLLSEKVKIKFKGKYFYILINNLSNFNLIYVENLITIGNSFKILENINEYYNKNIIKNSKNINLIREVNLQEQKNISNIISNYEVKYRKTAKNKILKNISQISIKKTIFPENSSRNGNLRILKDLSNNNKNNFNIKDKKISVVNNNIYNINNDRNKVNLSKTIVEENNEHNDISIYFNNKNKDEKIINKKKIKFIDDNPSYNIDTKIKELNNIYKLKFIRNNRTLSRTKIISFIFLILIAITIIGSICYVLITSKSI